MLLFAVAPFVIWTCITAKRQQLPFENAFPALLTSLTHVNDLFEAQGKIGGGMMIGSIVISLVIAVLMAMRVPLLLYFDLLDRKVEAREGRVVAREEQIEPGKWARSHREIFFLLTLLEYAGQSGGLPGVGSRIRLHRVPIAPERDLGVHRAQNGGLRRPPQLRRKSRPPKSSPE